MQRVSYEDSGIITDTRGQTSGTVTIKSSNDAPCNVSVPQGFISGQSGLFKNLFSKSLRLDTAIVNTAGSTNPISFGASSIYHIASTASGDHNFQLSIADDCQVLIILKPSSASGQTIGLIYTDGQKINDSAANVGGLLSGDTGIVFLVYRAAGSGVPPGWWYSTANIS